MKRDEHTFRNCSCFYAGKQCKPSYLGHRSYCKQSKESFLITATHKGPGFKHGMSQSQWKEGQERNLLDHRNQDINNLF